LGFWKKVTGMLCVEFTSADPEKTLDQIVLAQIPLSHILQKNELSYQFFIQQRDFHRLTELLRRRGISLRVIRHLGIYWKLKSSIERPVLLCLFLVLLFASLYLPTRVFFVSVEGNTTLTSREILSAAENCGIHFGASRKLVRSEQVKNELLSAVPQLQWAGVNTSGCNAVISVRERVREEPAAAPNTVTSLIADRDGYILSSTVTSGTAHFLPGETVTKGQLLVSGYTDCGIYIRATRAVGEIIAQTNRTVRAVMPQTCLVPKSVQKDKFQISLIIGKKRINLWKDSRISDTGCGRMYEEYYFSLPGGFQLPIAVCVDRYGFHELQEEAITEDSAQNQLQQFSEQYLLRQMTAGQIIQAQHTLSFDGVFRLDSSYVCTEMIGKEQREQNGVINGKRN